MARKVNDILQEFRKLNQGTLCNPLRSARVAQAREAAAWELMMDHNIPLLAADALLSDG